MAQDFGDDTGEKLLRYSLRLAKDMFDYMQRSPRFQQNKTVVKDQQKSQERNQTQDQLVSDIDTDRDLVAVPFGTRDDAIDFSQFCNSKNIFAQVLSGENDRGYVLLDREENAIDQGLLYEYGASNSKRYEAVIKIAEEFKQIKPLTQEQMNALVPVQMQTLTAKTPSREKPPSREKKGIATNTVSKETLNRGKGPNTQSVANTVTQIFNNLDENAIFERELNARQIGITFNKKGEYMFYAVSREHLLGGKPFPEFDRQRDWCVNASTLIVKYGVPAEIIERMESDFEREAHEDYVARSRTEVLEDQDRSVENLGNKEPVFTNAEAKAEWERAFGNNGQDISEDTQTQRKSLFDRFREKFSLNSEQSEQVTTDGTTDADGRTADLDQGVKCHDGMDTNTRSGRVEREQTGSEVAPSDIRREEEIVEDDEEYSLDSIGQECKEWSEDLAAARSAQVQDLSRFSQPEL